VPIFFLGTFKPQPNFQIADFVPPKTHTLRLGNDCDYYCPRLPGEEGWADPYSYAWDDHAVLATIARWFENLRSSHPHLKYLGLPDDTFDDGYKSHEDQVDRIEMLQLCGSRGVKVSFEESSWDGSED